MSRRTAFVYVQHLLGLGHFVRARQVAVALAQSGCDVHLVTGGMPVERPSVPGLRTIQLPPIRVSDASFAPLRDAAGEPIDDAYRARRRAALLAAYEQARPDIVVVETFPFGRRGLAFELVPLMERIHGSTPRPRVVASVRDILQRPRKPGRDQEVLDAAARWIDAVLVHGDPRFIALDATFPRARELAPPVHYTGFVCDAAPSDPDAVRDEVVVSAGGGAVGAKLVTTALQARERCSLRRLAWRVLAGANLALDVDAGDGVIVERGRDDLGAALARARLSISQAGYNTALEVAASGACAVLVPFAEGGETEQAMRADRLAALGLAVVVDEAGLTPQALAAAIDDAASRPRRRGFDFGFDGARRSAEVIGRMLDDTCTTQATTA